MIHIKSGNMWDVYDDGKSDLFLVTTNSTLRKDGSLVMGKGIAKEAKERFPTIDSVAGNYIKKRSLENGFYGVITDLLPNEHIGLFQTKYHWRDESSMILIDKSCYLLQRLVVETGKYHNVHLNYPGIGYGFLERDSVKEILHKHFSGIKDFPITIWIKP